MRKAQREASLRSTVRRTGCDLKRFGRCQLCGREVKKGERIKKAPIPFTTSTLQQEASKALNFSTQKTMRIAQQLYEGVEVKGHGTIGLITYLRTDSTRVADEADAAARSFVKEHYGENYAAAGEASAKNTGKIQDAHEAIRPNLYDKLTSKHQRRTLKRSVPFIPADLEPFHGKPYGTS